MNALKDPLFIGLFLLTVFMLIGIIASRCEKKKKRDSQ